MLFPLRSLYPLCLLCQSPRIAPWHRDKRRDYVLCEDCRLVFVPPSFHLSPDQEKAVYDLHRNDVADPGYRRFLNRVAEPLLQRLPTGCSGLDFGCGPGPALALMLREAGHDVALYDKFYCADDAVLQRTFDFVCATEVMEHLASPGAVLQQLFGLLRAGGWLVIMTKRVQDQAAFARWHYIQDLTHIAFFSAATFTWIGQHWNAQVEFAGADVVLLQKQS